MRTRIDSVRITLRSILAIGAVAVAVAGCGGGHATQNAQTTATQHQVASGSSPTSGIPQHNGGDQDADNNGGPSDGDGDI